MLASTAKVYGVPVPRAVRKRPGLTDRARSPAVVIKTWSDFASLPSFVDNSDAHDIVVELRERAERALKFGLTGKSRRLTAEADELERYEVKAYFLGLLRVVPVPVPVVPVSVVVFAVHLVPSPMVLPKKWDAVLLRGGSPPVTVTSDAASERGSSSAEVGSTFSLS